MRELFQGETVLALDQAQAAVDDTAATGDDGRQPPSDLSDNDAEAHTATVAASTSTTPFAKTLRWIAFVLFLLLAGVGGSRAYNQWSLKRNLQEALTAVETSKYNEAIDMFEAVITAQPEMQAQIADTYALVLQRYATQVAPEDPEMAQGLLQRAAALLPEDYRGHFKLGRSYLAAADYRRAIKAFQQVVMLAPDLDEAFFNLGYAYAMIGSFDQAEAMYQQALLLEPAYLDEIHFNLAVIQQQMGKSGDAIANLEKAIQVNPNNEPAHTFLAHVRAKNIVYSQEDYIE
jgi:tetratricopeptide (TPR) repeat protein